MGLLSREVSISSTLACEEVSSGGAETSTFRDGGMSVLQQPPPPWQSVLAHGYNHLPCLSQLSW